ncbi:MAG: CrcB family protein [Clostridiales bacterium]
MKKFIIIAIGGFSGANLRLFFNNVNKHHYEIPLNTLFINIVGCFLFCFFMTLIINKQDHISKFFPIILSGFLGAFTTFSTLCKETVQLLLNENIFNGIYYLVLSIVLGFVFALSGTYLAKKVLLFWQKIIIIREGL